MTLPSQCDYSQGYTALINASMNEGKGIVPVLTSKGADANESLTFENGAEQLPKTQSPKKKGIRMSSGC
jgi:hypothetical protein